MAGKRLSIDIHRKRLGQLYAKAYVGAAADAGELEPRMEELHSLVEDVFDRFPELDRMLSGAMLVHKERVVKLEAIFGPHASPMLLSFLKVLSAHDRLDCLRYILVEAERLIDEMHNRVEARVRTALPLEDEDRRRIRESLERMLAKEVKLAVEVDADLLGGVVLQVGDQVFDGSIRYQLDHMRSQIVQRSVQNIQDDRERFFLQQETG